MPMQLSEQTAARLITPKLVPEYVKGNTVLDQGGALTTAQIAGLAASGLGPVKWRNMLDEFNLTGEDEGDMACFAAGAELLEHLAPTVGRWSVRAFQQLMWHHCTGPWESLDQIAALRAHEAFEERPERPRRVLEEMLAEESGERLAAMLLGRQGTYVVKAGEGDRVVTFDGIPLRLTRDYLEA